jgi:hypothetical protein
MMMKISLGMQQMPNQTMKEEVIISATLSRL